MNCEEFIYNLAPFNQLREHELSIIKERSSTICLREGDLIYKQNTPITQIILLKSGCVEILERNKSGNNILHLITGPDFVELSNIFYSEMYLNSAVSVTPSELCYIDKESLKKAIVTNDGFAIGLMEYICAAEIKKFKTMSKLFRKRASERVAWLLLYFSDNVFKSIEFKLPLTGSEIANLLGISKRSFIRTIGELSHVQVIENSGSRIKILNHLLLSQQC